MDDEKWKKAVDKTEEVVFGYCALRENRKAKKEISRNTLSKLTSIH